jgi:hypothetical protein
MVNSISIILATTLLTWTFISLEGMHINVISQSPFFLYNNIIYIISIIITIVAIVLATYLYNSPLISTILLSILWSLILIAPYIAYVRSLPLYNDQLGFALEAIKGILQGHISPTQGDYSTLGHAYFTSTYTLICGFDPLWGVIGVQMMLPIFYIIPLNSFKLRTFYDKISISLIVLAAMLNPIYYGRTPFAWLYLIFLSFYLYNTFLGDEAKKPNTCMFMTFTLIYIAYVISDPTSLIIPIMLSIATLFNRKLITLTVSSIATWFTVNSVVYLSGSFYSILFQLEALIEHPVNPLPSLIAPPVNPTIKLYNYLRESTVVLNFSIGLILAVIIFFKVRKKAGGRNRLTWVSLYFVLLALQATAMTMNRWGMVPYSIYVLALLPVLSSLESRARLLKIIALLIAVPLLLLSPAIKWGFSPIAFPTSHDLEEVGYLVSYAAPQTTVCASGAHVLAEFYFRLQDASAPLRTLDPLPLLNSEQIAQCNSIAVFYKSFNTYRLGISEGQLMSIIAKIDESNNIIYREGVWTIWLR